MKQTETDRKSWTAAALIGTAIGSLVVLGLLSSPRRLPERRRPLPQTPAKTNSEHRPAARSETTVRAVFVRVLDGYGKMLSGDAISFSFASRESVPNAQWEALQARYRLELRGGVRVIACHREWGETSGVLSAGPLNVLRFETGDLTAEVYESIEDPVESLALVRDREGGEQQSFSLEIPEVSRDVPEDLPPAVKWEVTRTGIPPGRYRLVCRTRDSGVVREVRIPPGGHTRSWLNATDVNGSLTRRRLVLYLEVSAAHGVPLASEEVDYKLVYADGAFSSGSGRTDERGELRVEGSPAAPGSALHLCHQRHSCAEIPVDAPEGGVVDLGRVVLEGLANPTLVTILDSRGRPVAGADVTVAGRRFVTDRDGKFLFGAELGDYTASVRVAGLLSRGFSVDGSGEAVVALGHDFASFWIRAQRGDGRDLLAPVHLWLWPESGRRQVWGVEGVEGLEGAANVIGVEPADLGGPILITCVTGDDVFGKVTRLDEMRLSIAHDGVVTYWTTLERWDVGSVAFSAGNPWPVAVASRWEDVLLKRGAPEALRDFLEASGRSPLWSRSRREYFVVRFPFVEDGVVAIVCADRSDWSHELRYRDLLDLAGNRVPLSRQE